MDETKIGLSDKGITFSYRRYLSDSAAGFVLILLVLIFAGKTLGIQTFLAFPSEVRVFILFLSFLLSTPIGVLINAISWMFFETPQKWIEKIFIHRFFWGEFKKEFAFSESMKDWGIEKENWFEKIRRLETRLADKQSIVIDKIETLRGIAIFARNLSFIGAIITIYLAVTRYHWGLIFISALLSPFLLVVSAVVFFYLHVLIMFYAHETFIHKES